MLPYLAPLLAQEVGANLADTQHLRLLLRCAGGHAVSLRSARAMSCLGACRQAQPHGARPRASASPVVRSAIRALLSNAHLQLVPYIHHLLPGAIAGAHGWCLPCAGVLPSVSLAGATAAVLPGLASCRMPLVLHSPLQR